MTITIAAVAIGSNSDLLITAPIKPNTPGVRNYIPGLIGGLHTRGKTIGTDYKIAYRQRTEAYLYNSPGGAEEAFAGDLIFCMSSAVVRAAQNFTKEVGIVGIVSDPEDHIGGESFHHSDNICGVSAQRHQTARKCFDYFVDTTVPHLNAIIPLHKTDYNPSIQALALVEDQARQKHITIPTVLQAYDQDTLNNVLADLPSSARTGLLVLPADLFFANAPNIINAAQHKLPTHFFTTDWVSRALPSAVSGWGVSQLTCGELMAERVKYVWDKGVPIPETRWVDAPPSAFDWRASIAAAEALNITLAEKVPKI